MRVPREYDELLNGEDVYPSTVVAQLPGGHECPGVTDVLGWLDAAPFAVVEAHPVGDLSLTGARWEMQLRLRFDAGANQAPADDGSDEVSTLRLWAVPTEALDGFHFDRARLTATEREQAARSCWSLGLSTELDPTHPLDAFHQQLAVLAALAPQAAAIHDVSACRLHGGSWLREVALTHVPPPPDALFYIHVVCAEDERQAAWLHTHGLLRCGIPELEMLEVPRAAAPLCGQLLNSIAALFIENGLPAPNEPFEAGAGIALLWLPWERGLARVPGARRGVVCGGFDDRDAYHSLPGAVLFAPGRGLLRRKLQTPAIYLPLLEDNPVFYVSTMETERMAALARERFPAFTELFSLRQQEDGWVFLIKLGYPVDGAHSATDREHLWFHLHLLEGDGCEATLLNQPHAIARLDEGDRGQHELSLMSDWAILCPDGKFDPDTVHQLTAYPLTDQRTNGESPLNAP